jgi:hypothetical protein
MFEFDPRPLLLAAGLLYIAMPLAVLMLLYGRHPRVRVLAWCMGGVAMGVAACLFALRGSVPDWVSYPLANLFVFASVVIKVPVLQRERGLPAAAGVAVVLWALAGSLYTATWAAGWSTEARFSTTAVIQIVGTGMVAWHADRLARELDSLGARLIALAYGGYALMLALRTLRVLAGWSDGQALSPELDFLAVLSAALLAALCGNLGYLGVALDHARRHDLAQREALEQLRDQQRQLELSARARDAVRGERHRSSQVLAHEVRQPLAQRRGVAAGGIGRAVRSHRRGRCTARHGTGAGGDPPRLGVAGQHRGRRQPADRWRPPGAARCRPGHAGRPVPGRPAARRAPARARGPPGRAAQRPAGAQPDAPGAAQPADQRHACTPRPTPRCS